ncbi:MAG: glycosyltransferase family 4 protein [Chloroflexi bacterium]|nr:glycosyltransferase family 4 protein [Chloroflexota bacterium]
MVKYAALTDHKIKVFCSDRASWHGRTDESLLKRIPAGVEIVRVHAWFLADTLSWLGRLADSVRSSWLRRLILAIRWRLDYYWPDPVLYWAIKTALVAAWHARKDRPDCIFTTGPQHLSHFTGFLLNKWFGTVWVMDYRDPWTHPAEATEPAGQQPYQQKFFAWLEGRFIKQANAVTVVTPTWLDEIRRKFAGSTSAEKFHLVRNGHDLSPPEDNREEAFLLQLPERPVNVHFNGTIQSNNNLLLIFILAFEQLEREGINPQLLKFSFCGLPDDFKEVLRESPYAPCLVDFGAMDHATSLACCRDADALLVMVRSGGTPLYRGAIPGKTYEAIALGKYIFGVLPDKCDTRELLEEYPNATLTEDTSVSSIAHGMLRLLRLFEDSGRQLPPAPESIRQELAERYSRRSQADQLLEILRRELAALPD